MNDNSPVAFGYKLGWFAIRSMDRDAVVRSFQLSNPVEAPWRSGIDTVYKDAYNLLRSSSRVFVSPPVDGWVFVVGQWAMGNGEYQDLREIESRVVAASAEFGEAQAFATYRVVDYHHWVLARDGTLLRSFAVSGGEVFSDAGDPTPVELSLAWFPLNQEHAADDEESDEDREEGDLPGEDDVMKVAGSWSVNPQLLEVSFSDGGKGVLAVAPPTSKAAQDTAGTGGQRPWWRFWN
jgi:hypothetical protein